MSLVINTHILTDECAFNIYLGEDADGSYDIHKYLIPSLGLPEKKNGYPTGWENKTESIGHIAVLNDDKWMVKEVDLVDRRSNLYLICRETEHIQMDAMAYPIDPSMTREDIEGDSFPEPNATNTGWVFKHTRPGTHDDFERTLHAIVVATFANQIEEVMLKCLTASNRAAKREAQDRLANWRTFRNEVTTEAKKIHRGNVLGHYHRDPHPETGHYYAILSLAMGNVKARWKAASAKGGIARDRYGDVRHTIDTLVPAAHATEARHEKAARIAAAKKAAQGDDDD